MGKANEEQRRIPPYVAFKTFQTFLESLGDPLPGRIDRGVMKSMSGTAQTQVNHALKYFDLVSATGQPTEALKPLANGTEEERREALGALLRKHYPFLFGGGFSIGNATASQINEKFTALGASGNTVRLCAAFFVIAAEAAGMTVSPYIKERGRRAARNSPLAKRRSQTPKKSESPPEREGRQEMQTGLSEKEKKKFELFPPFDPSWPPETQQLWYENYHKAFGDQ